MRLLILGANSDIAKATAEKFVTEESADLYLASRNMERLESFAKDLEIRYAVSATPLYFDATDYESHQEFYNQLEPKPDGVIVAFGYLGDQEKAQMDFMEARKIIETNYLGAVSILEIIAQDFEQKEKGFVIGISSIAGDRGRQSNYIYGSAKAAFTVYLSGLRNRLYKSGMHVTTIKPGFVRTKMTEEIELSDHLITEPERVANKIYDSYKEKLNVRYVPWFWRLIMKIIKIIPEFIFKRLNL